MSARPNPDYAITQWLRDEADAAAPDRLVRAFHGLDRHRGPPRQILTMIPAAVLMATVAEPVATRIKAATSQPKSSGER